MKKLLIAILISLCFTISAFSQTIRITNGEWEPYLSEYSPQYGLWSHIVSEAFRLEGINIKWGFFGWSRAYNVAKKGKKWDASAVWWPTEEVKKDFFISEPVGKTSMVYFHLKNYPFDWKTIDDLKDNNIKIGVTQEYDYGKEFMQAMKNKKIRVETVQTDETNFKKLLGGRIQIFPNDPIVGSAQIRGLFSSDKVDLIIYHPKEFHISDVCLIISKNSPKAQYFLEKFNSGLKKFKATGQFRQMMSDVKVGKYAKQETKWGQ